MPAREVTFWIGWGADPSFFSVGGEERAWGKPGIVGASALDGGSEDGKD